MREATTLIHPDLPDARVRSSSLPPDLLEQVRGRVRLLALLLFCAFSFDLLIYLGKWVWTLLGHPAPSDFVGKGGFQWINLGAVTTSAALWTAARSRSVSATRLHALGLLYQIVICFIIALLTFWQYYSAHQLLPDLTWVPAVVILFPLILPGPPRRMLLAAFTAAAMSPLALLALDLSGKVAPDPDAYLRASVGPLFAVAFAYMGARVVYGLGRDIVAARELGSYQLVEKLGEGGMGEVWRARHRMLARPAAIKLIRAPKGVEDRARVSEEAIRRFEREAQVISSLRSPHTVELFDFGVASDGAFYYVMELLDGLDVDSLVRRTGPVPAERAIHLLRQICHSLSEAESCGVVHRDIKPANVFLCRYGEDHDFVKVLDFGIVKLPAEGAGPALTRENAFHGTPAFIAPEQALGQTDLDGRADIYATGCVAYWLLTGQLVFEAETPMALCLKHVQIQPAPPSTRTEMPISAALDRLVMSCLEKDPGSRPQTARELSRRLAEVEGANLWTEERARQWWTVHQPARPWR